MLCFFCFSLPSFSDTTPDGQSILYCPQEIQCMVSGKIDTCYVSDDPYEIWGRGYPYNEGRIVKGVYKFKKAFSSYQKDQPDNRPIADCLYSNTDKLGVERLMQLYYGGGYYFEAFLNITSQWSVLGYNAECLTNNPQLCPFVEFPEISYFSEKNKYGYFKIYYNESNPNYYLPQLSYNQLLSACGATSVCKIDVAISTDQSGGSQGDKINIGTVTVDISKPDFVKIVNIDTFPSSDCTLKKKEPFNTIYCEPKKKQ